MSDARLKTKIRNLVRENLASLGFILARPRMPQRQCPGLRQSLEFQPGTGHLAGSYTINVCWSFLIAPRDWEALDGYRRIGELAGQGDTWYSREPNRFEEDFARATTLVLNVAVPYLERYSNVNAIVTAYEEGTLSRSHAFGPDRGWQSFNLGYCYSYLGRTAPAISNLRAVIEEHSSEPYDFIQVRTHLAKEEILSLERA